MRSLKAACISLILVGGLCIAQADQPNGLFARDRIDPTAVQVVPPDDQLTGDWCATNRVWAQRAEELGLAERSDCPLMGECDDPALRDACIGDLDGDDVTGQSDLGILLADWGCGT